MFFLLLLLVGLPEKAKQDQKHRPLNTHWPKAENCERSPFTAREKRKHKEPQTDREMSLARAAKVSGLSRQSLLMGGRIVSSLPLVRSSFNVSSALRQHRVALPHTPFVPSPSLGGSQNAASLRSFPIFPQQVQQILKGLDNVRVKLSHVVPQRPSLFAATAATGGAAAATTTTTTTTTTTVVSDSVTAGIPGAPINPSTCSLVVVAAAAVFLLKYSNNPLRCFQSL
jgi:hypothetical protein